MKVALVTPFFPPHPGGLERHVLELADGLHERGLDVCIVTADIPSTSDPPHRKYPVMRLRSGTIGFDSWPTGLRGALDSIRPNVVHTHAPLSIFSTLATFAAQGRIPIVSTYHGDYHKSSAIGNFIKLLRNRLQLPLTLGYADAVVVLTRHDRDLLAGFGIDRRKIRIIHPGIDLRSFAPESGDRGHSSKKLLYVGRVVYEKGIRELVLAFSGLSKLVKDAELVVAGNGYALDEMKALAKKLGAGPKVRFTGWLDHPEVLRLYREAELFVLPSRCEGMPYAVLEAMASGRPVVARRVSGLDELVADGRSGILYDPEKGQGLRDALLRLLEDPAECRRMGECGAALCQERYGRERWLDETEMLYEKVA